MPRFYQKEDGTEGERIYVAPGDRIYISDVNADVFVSNYQKMDYEPSSDSVPIFPIVKIENIIDSKNIEYNEHVDFVITKAGNIRWVDGGKNPGIDPDTGKGRIFSVRYLYRAYWYITAIPKEVRVTNVTTGGVRKPERMPYHAVIVREYVFHNQNKGDESNQLTTKEPNRTVTAPTEGVKSSSEIIVDMAAIGEDEE
jgi:hypothetical protein